MTRLAHHCVEMGMENEEVFSMLLDADERWGKFKTRPPEQRRQRLIGIIQHVRSKKSFESVLDIHNDIVIQTLGDFLDAEEPEINWVFDGLLAEQGLGTIASIPGVGKSTLSFQLAIKSTISHDFLKWANRKQLHAAVLSFEMQANECRPFMEHMLRGYSKEEVTYLRQNLGVWAYGSKFEFNNKEKRRGLLDAIDIKESKFIIIDSLKQIVTRMRDEELDEVYEFINKDLRKDRGCTVWIIHHLRKPANEGPRKPQDISDLYGDQYIGAFATSVLGLWKRSFNQVEVMNFKTRMAPETPPFVIERAQYLDFVITDNPAPENHSPVAKGGDNGEGNSEPSTGIGI
jgi:predicted ATP-dependent serine protease